MRKSLFYGELVEQLPTIEAGGCKFSCYTSKIKTKKGSEYHRLFCKKAERTCKLYRTETIISPIVEKLIAVNHQPSGGKEWVAEIIGRDPKYNVKRQFLNPVEKDWSSSGKTGITKFELIEGKIYEINEPYKKRRFVLLDKGELHELSIEKVLKIVGS